MNNKHLGSNFDDFLNEEGILEEVNIGSIKKILAIELQKKMEFQKITKTSLAKQLNTSRTQVDRLLDPENTSITLITMVKAAKILNKNIKMTLI